MHTQKCTYTDTHERMHTHTCIHTDADIHCAQAHTSTHRHHTEIVRVHTYIVCTHMCVHACMHMYTSMFFLPAPNANASRVSSRR